MQPINDILMMLIWHKNASFSRIVGTRTFLPVIFLKLLQIDIFGPSSCKIDILLVYGYKKVKQKKKKCKYLNNCSVVVANNGLIV